MASLDIVSLSTSIPLHETIDICITKLFPKLETLLNLAVKELFFTFRNRFYIQVELSWVPPLVQRKFSPYIMRNITHFCF